MTRSETPMNFSPRVLLSLPRSLHLRQVCVSTTALVPPAAGHSLVVVTRRLLARPLAVLRASRARLLGRAGTAPPDAVAIPGTCAAIQTDQHALAEDHAGSAEAHRIVAESTVDVIVRCDARRRRLYVSPSCTEILGYSQAELLGGHALALVHPEDCAYVERVLATLGPDRSRASAEFRMLLKDGSYRWVEGRYRYLPTDQGMVSVLRDISLRKRTEFLLADTNERLEAANIALTALAAQDGLTGLANRRHFDKLLEEEYRRAARLESPLGMVLLDIDNFKRYNDRYGHPAGDDCLRTVSQVIASLLRRGGEQAARYGGEEIAVLLPGTDEAGARVMAERMVAAVRASAIPHRDSATRVVTISAGVSGVIPASGGSPRRLVEAADRALYWAKARGRNCVEAHSPAVRVAAALSANHFVSM